MREAVITFAVVTLVATSAAPKRWAGRQAERNRRMSDTWSSGLGMHPLSL